MSKLKFVVLHFVPLCLKLRGRIVGAISRGTVTMYVASGLLFVSSILLVIIFFGMKNFPNKIVEPVEDQSAVIVVSPQPVAPQPVSPLVPKAIDSQPAKDVLAVSKTIKGPIKVDFGWQLHEVYKDWRYHTGIDISGPVGHPAEAIYNGQVTDIVRDNHSGLTVVVKNSTYSVYYGSLSEVKVDKGSHINAGQTIGTMGSCDAEQYNHLHLAIKKGEQYIDPKLIINQ